MTTTTSSLTVTDCDSGLDLNFTNDATGWQAAFEQFASAESLDRLAKPLADGAFFESFSGKGTAVIERDREPLRFWQTLCGLIETDNQTWTVG